MALNFQETGSRLVGRALLIGFLAVSLVLTTVYAREGEGGPLHALQGAVRAVIAPAGHAGAAMSAARNATLDAAADVSASVEALSALKDQNAELRGLLSDAEEYRQEAERLKGLLAMRDASGVSGVGARVVGMAADTWDRSVTIDAGENQGISPGMAVMGSAGVVGLVVQVGADTAAVRLLADADSGAACMVQSSRAQGIVRGSPEGLLYLEVVDEDEIPQVGDVVVTSGLGGSYPSGLIVGTVVSVNASTGNATGRIVVSQNASVSALEEVLVVTSDKTAVDDGDAQRARAGAGA